MKCPSVCRGLDDVDVELGAMRETNANPMHLEGEGEAGQLSRGDSERVAETLEKQAEGVARKGLKADGAEAWEGMNSGALGKLFEGGRGSGYY